MSYRSTYIQGVRVAAVVAGWRVACVVGVDTAFSPARPLGLLQRGPLRTSLIHLFAVFWASRRLYRRQGLLERRVYLVIDLRLDPGLITTYYYRLSFSDFVGCT